MTALLGIDFGTSSVKTALIDADTLNVLGSASEEYPVFHPQTGYAEQNPEDWWQATVKTVREVISKQRNIEISGIGLSGHMHGTVCLGKDGNWVRPAIIWADTRTVTEVQALTDMVRAEPEKFKNISGLPAAGFMVVTLMWLAKYEPDTLQKTHKVLLAKDAIRYKMTGTIGTDWSDASATWLFDVVNGGWSDWVLSVCGIDPDLLPDLAQSMDVVGQLTSSAAEELGLSAGIPVVVGSADLPAQALGYGLYNEGTGMVTVGTGGQVVVPLHEPTLDPDHRYYTFTHNVPDRWYAQAAILSAGLSLRWLRDLIGMQDRPDGYQHLSSLATEVPLGADNLIFLPYLAGERTPHMNPSASSLFFGLRLHHQQGHLARAVMEGVAFALRSCLDLVAEDVSQVLLSGGAADSVIWRQILADVFNVPLVIAESAPYGCIGCAIMAGVGTQVYSSVDDAVSRRSAPQRQIDPVSDHVARYQGYYEQYLRLYPLLKEEMDNLILLG